MVTLSSIDEENDPPIPGGTVVIINSTFHNNRATLQNAAVVYGGEGTTINVTSGLFYDNEALEDGAVIAADEDSTINVDGGNFTGNFAEGVRPLFAPPAPDSRIFLPMSMVLRFPPAQAGPFERNVVR